MIPAPKLVKNRNFWSYAQINGELSEHMSLTAEMAVLPKYPFFTVIVYSLRLMSAPAFACYP